jgi:hypothetical protein
MMVVQTVPTVKVSYTNADWRSLREELLARIPVLSEGRWTDLNESDLGIALIELLVGMQDEMLFYLDKKFSESQLPTARQRVNVKNLLKLIAYDMSGYAAGSGQVSISVQPSSSAPKYGTVNGHANSILVPAGTELVGRSDSTETVTFYTTDDCYLTPPGPNVQGYAIVGVVQGRKLTSPEVFAADGTTNQRYVLRTENVARDLLIVKVGTTENSALSWSRVSSFLTSEANDTVFVTTDDEKGNVYVQFGDGKFGKIPALGQNIYVYPVITLGAVGNLPAGTITQVLSSVEDADGNPVNLTATNTNAISGGGDPETIEIAKRNGPALLSALFRAMSKNDYIALTQSISGVDKANAWGEQEEDHPNIKLINRVMVTFLALDTNGNLIDPDSAQYATIEENVSVLLEERKPVTTRIVFKAPEYVDLIVTATVAVDRTKYDPAIVAADVKLAVQDYFAYANVNFGQDARQSLVAKLISSVPGVSWATVKLSQSTYGTISLPPGMKIMTQVGWTETTPDFADISVSRWQLIRISDFDADNNAVFGYRADGSVIEHVRITTTTNVDSPVPDPMPDPCVYTGTDTTGNSTGDNTGDSTVTRGVNG